MESRRTFSRFDLTHFDLVISTEYLVWMVEDLHHCTTFSGSRGLHYMDHCVGLPAEGGVVAQAGPCPLVALMDGSRQ